MHASDSNTPCPQLVWRDVPISGRGRGEADWSDRSDQRECRDLQTEAICGGCYFIV